MKKLILILVVIVTSLSCKPKYIGEHKGWSVYDVGHSKGRYLYKCNYRHDHYYSNVNLITNPNGNYVNKKIDMSKYKE